MTPLAAKLAEIQRWRTRLDNPAATWSFERTTNEFVTSLEYITDLLSMLTAARDETLEEAARLHESIDPACDHERLDRIPGAGAMGFILRYRDAIRVLKTKPKEQ